MVVNGPGIHTKHDKNKQLYNSYEFLLNSDKTTVGPYSLFIDRRTTNSISLTTTLSEVAFDLDQSDDAPFQLKY